MTIEVFVFLVFTAVCGGVLLIEWLNKPKYKIVLLFLTFLWIGIAGAITWYLILWIRG